MPGCPHTGEFRAPVQPANFDGPGVYRLLCLDHVREHNLSYNYFNGMSTDQITEAQTTYGGWDRPTLAFASFGGDPPPAWSDFTDPLEAISGRFRRAPRGGTPSRFSRAEQRALAVLGLGEDTDLHAVRRRYSELVRRYHPDRNGGDRSKEKQLGEVIGAYQALKSATAFA